MITVGGQMFIEYEKEIDNSNQIIKGYEVYKVDNKIRKEIIDKVCGDNVKDICSEKDEERIVTNLQCELTAHIV